MQLIGRDVANSSVIPVFYTGPVTNSEQVAPLRNITQLTTLSLLPAGIQNIGLPILAPTNLPNPIVIQKEVIPRPTIQRTDLAYFFSEKKFIQYLKQNEGAITKERAKPLYKILEGSGGIKLSQHHIIQEGEIRNEFANWISQAPLSEISRELRFFARSLPIIHNDFDRLLEMPSFQTAPDQSNLLYDRLIPWVSYFPGVLVAGPEEGNRIDPPGANFDTEIVNPHIREEVSNIWSKNKLSSPLRRLLFIQKLVNSHPGPRWELFTGKWRVKDYEGEHPNVEKLIQIHEETKRFNIQSGQKD